MKRLLEHPDVADLVRLALREDHVTEDITSRVLVFPQARGLAEVVAHDEGVAAGLLLLDPASPLLEPFPGVEATLLVEEGARVASGQGVARLAGPARELLGLERVLLNFLQRLSGIATLTARFVDALRGTSARVQETRKTCPGWRLLDKYAVALGGGLNHRLHLGDQVLIKENHLAFRLDGGHRADAIIQCVELARKWSPEGTVVEVEVETIEEFQAALLVGPDVIMLDQMSDEDTRKAVELRKRLGRGPLIEVSGGVSLDRVRALARLGVDRISVGQLTHSAPALDLSMDITPEASPE